jgi:UDP-glucose 4-epimerase
MTLALITGARGFLGRHLVAALSARGVAVAGVGHGQWPAAEWADAGVTRWVNGEIDSANLDLLRAEAGTPTTIYHLAGGSVVGPSFANPLEDFERTVATSARLFDWVRRNAPEARIVAVSSAAVYGAGHHLPIGEDALLNPYSPYGHHKRLMEGLCRSYGQNFGLRTAIVRVFSAFGPGLRKQLLWDLCNRLAAGTSPLVLDGTGAERRDWMAATDVAQLLMHVGSCLPSVDAPIVNGGTGRGYSVAEFAQAVLGAWGSAAPVRFTGISRLGDPVELVADVSKLHRLGYTPEVSLPQGIAQYIEWFRQARGR